jgi:rare lipoprotein A
LRVRTLAELALFLALAFFVITHAKAETCRASYYGFESGKRTANGERFNPNGLTIALRSPPRGERYRVTYRGRSVIVRHNDFGPAIRTRCADLSLGAARALGLVRPGIGLITIERMK